MEPFRRHFLRYWRQPEMCHIGISVLHCLKPALQTASTKLNFADQGKIPVALVLANCVQAHSKIAKDTTLMGHPLC
jgi:hypothetical protein